MADSIHGRDLNQETLDAVLEASGRLAIEWADNPDVLFVGVGWRPYVPDFVLLVYVKDEAAAESLPPTMYGLPVEYSADSQPCCE